MAASRGRVTIRVASADDAVAMADVDSASWPVALAVSAEQYRARIEIYVPGQLVAVADNRIVGVSSAQRITAAQLKKNGADYDHITDCGQIRRTHQPEGTVYQLLNVGVLPEARGQHLGRQLVDAQIAFARRLASVRRIVGYTRPAGFYRFPDLTIEQYLNRSPDERELDTVVAFHLLAGARIVSVHRNFRSADAEARGYGVLIEYPRSVATSHNG